MSSAISSFGKWAASLLVVLGCSQDTRLEYQHEPTLSIEKERTLARPELQPFTVDGVVIAPLLRMLTPQSTQLWLRCWSASTKPVSARAALLTGAGAQSAQSQQFAAEQSTVTDKTDLKGIQYGLILLGELGNDALASLSASGTARLAVDVKVGPGAEFKRLSFEITRHTTKQWATH